MKNKFEKLKGVFKKVRIEYLVVAALGIVALIIVLKSFPSQNAEEKSVGDIESYVSTLEGKLEECLKQVNGAGKVSVIISVASGVEEVYATEKVYDSKGNVTETPVLIGGKPVLLKENYPEIVGVVIVAEGAKNLSVKVDLLNACKVFLSIDESKIKVLST